MKKINIDFSSWVYVLKIGFKRIWSHCFYLYFHFTKKLLISPIPYVLNLVALHQSIVAQHRPKNNDDDDNDNDNADDGDEDGNGDGDDSDAHQSAVAEPRLNNK